MSNEKINRALAEAMGKCWHQFNNDCVCQKPGCSADNSFRNENPDYFNSLPDAFELVEWMRREKGFGFKIGGNYLGWRVRISGPPSADVAHESLPTAIALAAAAALQIEIEEEV